MKAVLASKNPHKLAEIQAILSGLGVEVVMESELGLDIDVDETGTTFEENSRLKAEAVMRAANMPAIADDSGLMVDALDGAPGVHSARYGPKGHDGTDDERIAFLLENMKDVPEAARTATAARATSENCSTCSGAMLPGMSCETMSVSTSSSAARMPRLAG